MTKWLVTGASGLLGHHICKYLVSKGEQVVALCNQHPVDVAGVTSHALDMLDTSKLREVIDRERPDYIYHTAAIANVDLCEQEPKKAYEYNVDLPVSLALLSREYGGRLLHVTTDQLWTGDKVNVKEDEPVSPINVYGKTKALSEQKVLDAMPDALILRTNFFGEGRPWRKSFSDWLYGELSQGKSIQGFDDIFYTPIAIDYLAPYSVELATRKANGIFHLAGSERISKYDFIRKFSEIFELDESLIRKGSSNEGNLAAPRPKDMSLSVRKVEEFLQKSMPSVEESILKLVKTV